MTAIDMPTVESAMRIIRQLPRSERARLIALVATELVEPEAVAPGGEISPLGAKLWALRREIEASGVVLLDDEGLQAEIAERRGGR